MKSKTRLSANNSNPVVGIIGGRGRMGRLFADFFKQGLLGVRPKVLIADIGTRLKNKELAERSDIIIISVPIDKTEKVIAEVLPHIRPDSAIMDFTSIKEMPVRAMLKGKCEVLGMHPMFGNTNPIPGQTVIFCPTKKSGHWSKWMENFLLKNGVRIEKMTPSEHDKTMNIAQGLIHFAEITFADAIRRCRLPIRQLLKYTGKASELKIQLAARIIAQDAGLYGSIQIANPYALKSLREFSKSIEELLKIVAKKDLPGFKKYFEKNRKFYGKYLSEAYGDSSYLIDKLLELKSGYSKKASSRPRKPAKNDLALLGPANTFSHIAADKYSNAPKYFAHDIDEVFDLVEKGTVAAGLVPIENKLHGSVRETLDALFSKNVQITGELTIPIHHCLICHAHAKRSDIKNIISHSQAISQCKKYLQKNFPRTETESVTSTGAAIEKLLSSNDKSLAVIAPETALQNGKLKILAKNIEDEEANATTFVVIRQGLCPSDGRQHLRDDENYPRGQVSRTFPESSNSHKTSIAPVKATTYHSSRTPAKTSIAFYFNADAPGSLFTVFQDFAAAKINLTKIESRPTRKQFGDYIFYLDFSGHISEPRIQKVLKTVEHKVAKLKVLGSY